MDREDRQEMARPIVAVFSRQVAGRMTVAGTAKLPGDICRCQMSFQRKGDAGPLLLWWYLAPGIGWVPGPHRINDGVAFGPWQFDMTQDWDWKTYSRTLEIAFPDSFPHSRIDCYLELRTAVSSTGQVELVLDGWWDDTYNYLAAEYSNLKATFS